MLVPEIINDIELSILRHESTLPWTCLASSPHEILVSQDHAGHGIEIQQGSHRRQHVIFTQKKMASIRRRYAPSNWYDDMIIIIDILEPLDFQELGSISARVLINQSVRHQIFKNKAHLWSFKHFVFVMIWWSDDLMIWWYRVFLASLSPCIGWRTISSDLFSSKSSSKMFVMTN